MPVCNCCKKSKSAFILNNKLVCFRCDELLFDIEIECDDATKPTKEKFEKRIGTVETASLAAKKVGETE